MIPHKSRPKLDDATAGNRALAAESEIAHKPCRDAAALEIVDLTDAINSDSKAHASWRETPRLFLADAARDSLEALLAVHLGLFEDEFCRCMEVANTFQDVNRRWEYSSQAMAFMDHVEKIAEHLRKYQNHGHQDVVVKHVMVGHPSRGTDKAVLRKARPSDETKIATKWQEFEKFGRRQSPELFLADVAENPRDVISLEHVRVLHTEIDHCFRAAASCFDPHARLSYMKQARIYSERVLKIAYNLRKHEAKGRQQITVTHETVTIPAARKRRGVVSAAQQRPASRMKKRLAG